ncbi:GNAT family N-acetyltransferase [Micromonospora sp. HM5-17]|uniref:GNAT family N-acetyltransferase n=1 Tax=Micromonospora sp. HM5-17 TaxID=2487710 RepID=UPI00131550A8|nr:GNAT family N-acetyltransferase [Micromonospora sp. HM5-17]
MTTTAFPPIRIETQRLVVAEFEAADAGNVAVVIAAGEWDALPPGAPRDAGAVWRWLRTDLGVFREAGQGVHLAIRQRDSGTHVGAMSLFRLDRRQGTAEVGYGLRPAMRGRGYAVEALSALTAWALSTGGLRRVDAVTAPENAASQRVAERAGYLRVGVTRDPLTGREMLVYRRTRAD